MDKKILYVAFLLVSGALVSCNGNFLGAGSRGKNGISVSVSGVRNTKTKSMEQNCIGNYEIADENGYGFSVSVFADENTSSPFMADGDTKGSIVTTGSINVDGQKFIMNAWLGSENRYPNDLVLPTYEEGGSNGRVNFAGDENKYRFIENADVTYDGSSWSLLDGSGQEYVWRNSVPTVFWSIYPEISTSGDSRTMVWPADKADDASQKVLSFGYSNQPASSQKDLLFAYNYQRASFGSTSGEPDYGKLIDGTSDEVKITFHHALAAIRFDITPLLSKSFQIQGISFSGLLAEGECTVSGSGSNGALFAWEASGTETTGCTLNLAASDFTDRSLDDTADNALMPLTSDKFLFLMPQEISGKGVMLGITFLNSEGLSVTKSVELDHIPWEAGMIYTYRLNPSDDKVDVEVIETVDVNVKSDVKVKNSGNVKEYLRVSITGNWMQNDEVVAPWTFDRSAFTGFNTTGWTMGADGYIYSNAKVDPGTEVDLFTRFVTPAPPFPGSELDMYIVAQAVAAGDAADWNAAITSSN